MSNTPLLKIDIPLTAPVPVKGQDGKSAERTTLTMRRPRTVHAKRLAILIGADLVKALMTSTKEGDAPKEGEAEKVDAQKLAVNLFEALLSKDGLDELTGIIADMCDEDAAIIDQLDLVDLWAVVKGFADFFPGLQSFVSTSLARIAQLSTDGDPQT